MKPSPAITLVDRLASLGDPVRLRLLRLVEGQELSVGEIGKVVQLPQSTVSRHLKTLADAGWLARRHEGTATLFSLVPDDLTSDARTLWAAVRGQVDSQDELKEDQKRLRAVLAERRTDSQSFFGRHGGEWDDLRNELFGGRFTSVALLSLIHRDWVIADLGCGTGNAAEFLAPFVERVYAVDQSGPMLTAARQRLERVVNVDFVEAAIETTGLADASVDAAVCVLVLHHVEDPASALGEMRRILRRGRGGGKVLIVDMLSHGREEYRRLMGHKHLGFSKDEMTRMMTEAGFVDCLYHELPEEPDAKGPGLFAATGRCG
ncbi:putative S-adenosylmethionine-dependent methyltransferase [Phycisphaerales bacterium]|nr:putative S-adenosylmethionine-dependent methyltransferase [Phycisphaerales bacterium]